MSFAFIRTKIKLYTHWRYNKGEEGMGKKKDDNGFFHILWCSWDESQGLHLELGHRTFSDLISWFRQLKISPNWDSLETPQTLRKGTTNSCPLTPVLWGTSQSFSWSDCTYPLIKYSAVIKMEFKRQNFLLLPPSLPSPHPCPFPFPFSLLFLSSPHLSPWGQAEVGGSDLGRADWGTLTNNPHNPSAQNLTSQTTKILSWAQSWACGSVTNPKRTSGVSPGSEHHKPDVAGSLFAV